MNQSLGLDKLQQTKRKKMKLRFGPQIAAKDSNRKMRLKGYIEALADAR